MHSFVILQAKSLRKYGIWLITRVHKTHQPSSDPNRTPTSLPHICQCNFHYVGVSKDAIGIRRVTFGEDDTEDDLKEDIESLRARAKSLSQFKHGYFIFHEALTETIKGF